MIPGGNAQEPNIWRQMQAAAARGDYILAGKLQAALAQTQLNAYAESVAKEMTNAMVFDGH